MKELYIDKYGQVWEKIGDRVWKADTGWGGWWDGQGLKPYKEAL